MDRATAAFYGLPVVSIGTSNDPAAATFVAPTDEAVSKGVDAMIDGGQGTEKANVVPRDSTAYPLPVTIYAQIPTDSSITSATATSLKTWLTYMRDLTTLPPGYVPLTDGQKSAITDALTKVTGQPEPTPSPTPSPTSTTSDATDSPSFATDADAPTDSIDTAVETPAESAPLVSIFAASTEPVSGTGGFLLPVLVLLGAASSISGALRLTGRSRL
jgi:hypothetical protein